MERECESEAAQRGLHTLIVGSVVALIAGQAMSGRARVHIAANSFLKLLQMASASCISRLSMNMKQGRSPRGLAVPGTNRLGRTSTTKLWCYSWETGKRTNSFAKKSHFRRVLAA